MVGKRLCLDVALRCVCFNYFTVSTFCSFEVLGRIFDPSTKKTTDTKIHDICTVPLHTYAYLCRIIHYSMSVTLLCFCPTNVQVLFVVLISVGMRGMQTMQQ